MNFYEQALADDVARTKALKAAELAKRKHYVNIIVRGCVTDRDCYCTVTNGADHDEWQFPWVHADGTYDRGGDPEKPLEFPMRKGEDYESWSRRRAAHEAWQKGWDDCYRQNGFSPVNPYALDGDETPWEE